MSDRLNWLLASFLKHAHNFYYCIVSILLIFSQHVPVQKSIDVLIDLAERTCFYDG